MHRRPITHTLLAGLALTTLPLMGGCVVRARPGPVAATSPVYVNQPIAQPVVYQNPAPVYVAPAPQYSYTYYQSPRPNRVVYHHAPAPRHVHVRPAPRPHRVHVRPAPRPHRVVHHRRAPAHRVVHVRPAPRGCRGRCR